MNPTKPFSHFSGPEWNIRVAAHIDSTLKSASLRSAQAARWLLCATPLAFALIAVLMGRESGWDLQNYHWYNPYALLNHRLGFDIAVAHHATYYNPLIDVPFYLLASHAPAWVAGAYLGFLFGIAVALIGAIAYRATAIKDPNLRLGIAMVLALAGAFGGGAWSSIGNTTNDVPAAIGIFAALLIVTRLSAQLRQATFDVSVVRALALAGLCAGAAAGLKLTNMVYVLGLCAAVCVCTAGWRQRGRNLLSLGTGLFVGFCAFGGYWMLRLWQYGGNPVFPYFNQLFHSKLVVADSFRDPSFRPDHWLTGWLYPFFFSADSHLVSESSFRDGHIAAVYALLPITALIMLRRAHRDGRHWVEPRLAAFLFVFAAVSYTAWLLIFSVYRYLIPLEMLSPLLIAAAIAQWPIQQKHQFALLAAILIGLQAWMRIDPDAPREKWDRAYVAVQTPMLPDPRRTMILMSGVSPMAFAIPSFPREIPFVRIDGWMIWKDDATSGLALEMHARVEQHRGPLYLMFADWEAARAREAAAEYGLRLIDGSCDFVRSNVTEPLHLCRLARS